MVSCFSHSLKKAVNAPLTSVIFGKILHGRLWLLVTQQPRLKIYHESRILAGYYGFNANISFTFQAVKNLYGHPAYVCFGPFVIFLVLISKIYGNKKFLKIWCCFKIRI